MRINNLTLTLFSTSFILFLYSLFSLSCYSFCLFSFFVFSTLFCFLFRRLFWFLPFRFSAFHPPLHFLTSTFLDFTSQPHLSTLFSTLYTTSTYTYTAYTYTAYTYKYTYTYNNQHGLRRHPERGSRRARVLQAGLLQQERHPKRDQAVFPLSQSPDYKQKKSKLTGQDYKQN